MFPLGDTLGIALALPYFTCQRANRGRLGAVLLTHGHEDHIGGLPYLLREIEVPVYGTRLTLCLVRPKLEEHGLLEGAEFNEVADGATVTIGRARVTFVPITHSVPHGCALAIETPQGVILHSGDFKIDHTPVDGRVS